MLKHWDIFMLREHLNVGQDSGGFVRIPSVTMGKREQRKFSLIVIICIYLYAAYTLMTQNHRIVKKLHNALSYKI